MENNEWPPKEFLEKFREYKETVPVMRPINAMDGLQQYLETFEDNEKEELLSVFWAIQNKVDLPMKMRIGQQLHIATTPLLTIWFVIDETDDLGDTLLVDVKRSIETENKVDLNEITQLEENYDN